MSIVGRRVGPNKVSIGGFLQPLGDALKLSNKQVNVLSNSSSFFYYIRAMIILLSSFLLWLILFSEPSPLSIKYGIIIFIIILGINSLNSILAGWRTISKFSLIGSLRTVAQLISYESVLYLCIFFCLIIYSTFSFNLIEFYPIPTLLLIFPFCWYIWIPSFLAELNRTPYDFSEGERELVRGFNTEFGSKSFTLIFLAEYRNIIFFCLISRFLFRWEILTLFFMILIIFVIWIRSVLPRLRFDKLIMLAWKFFIPFLTVIFVISIIYIN